MDIKRVAFETKSVSSPRSKVASQSSGDFVVADQKPKAETRQTVKREEISAIVDKFLRQKIAETPAETASINLQAKATNGEAQNANPSTESPVKTIIHQLRTENATNGAKPKTVDFISEEDVKRAIENGEKIYITAKTIITPSARDLGEEKDVFAKVQ